jgi:hypothetical protein
MNTPTTRKELCKYINKILTDLLHEAKDRVDQCADITFTIKGNNTFIYEYIESMCDEYNGKNNIWKCCAENSGDDPKYTLTVSHVDDYGDGFGWIRDDDTPLDGSNTDSDDNDTGVIPSCCNGVEGCSECKSDCDADA